MSLTEIETVVDRLSMEEQQELLRHLEENLRNRKTSTGHTSREGWMRRLDSLRASIGSPTAAISSEQILADLRED